MLPRRGASDCLKVSGEGSATAFRLSESARRGLGNRLPSAQKCPASARRWVSDCPKVPAEGSSTVFRLLKPPAEGSSTAFRLPEAARRVLFSMVCIHCNLFISLLFRDCHSACTELSFCDCYSACTACTELSFRNCYSACTACTELSFRGCYSAYTGPCVSVVHGVMLPVAVTPVRVMSTS